MAITAFTGPGVIYGQRPAVNNFVPDYVSDASPSLAYLGIGILDPRFGYFTGDNLGWRALGFQSSSNIPVLDVIPSTISVVNIAASQAPTANTALTLVSTTGAGVTVLAAATLMPTAGTTIPKGALALDGASGIVSFTTSGTGGVGFYDPTKAIARNVRVTTNGNDASGFYNVVGFDIYGYPMTERITGVSSAVASGKKAFKFITSITPTGTIASTLVTVGTGDVIGLPIRADTFGDLNINYPATVITANTGFTAAVTTSPATNITGDVRGTYALQSPSNGTNRLQIAVTPKLANLSITGLFGVTQV